MWNPVRCGIWVEPVELVSGRGLWVELICKVSGDVGKGCGM